MYKKIKSVLLNLALTCASLLFVFIILEFIVFRFLLPASDFPTPYFADGVIRYKPGQEGIYRVKNEIKAKFRINSDGWNSGYKEYRTKKDSDKYRIAVIGDSYIEALQVDYDKSLAEQLESKLGNNSEVFRFGISGAPLSQYLHMLRKEVLQYCPDLVIINVIHNDFEESYEFQPGIYSSSFMKLKIDNNAVSEEVQPVKYETTWYNWIRSESAIWRYLTHRQQIRFSMLRNMILGENKADYQANIDISGMEKNAKNNKIITEYIFRNMKKICDSEGIALLILMDGDRGSIYGNTDTPQQRQYDKGPLMLNRMAASVAMENHIEFLDLHNIFRENYLNNRKPFNFVNDGHWNLYAHELVADTVADYIKTHEILKKHAIRN